MLYSMKELTAPQSKLLAFLVKFLAENQTPPTRAEISEHFGWASANAAEEHLRALAKKGAIALKAGKARGIFILNANR